MAIGLRYAIIVAVGYLLGNFSGGILVSKIFGIRDIRKHGSGNAGTTNVLRTLGWLPSVMTLAGDCLKGLIAAEIGRALGGEIGMLVGGSCAIVGHDYPVFFRFRGGKGIATSLGLIIAINGWIALIVTLLVIIVAGTIRYMSVGSIAASVLYPFLTAIFMRGNPHYAAYIWASVFASCLSLFCHRKNIARLIRHEENKLDFEKISKLSQRARKIKGEED